MPKHRRSNAAKVRVNDPLRHAAQLPVEQRAQIAFVFNGHSKRVVAPWARGTPLTPQEQAAPLAVLERVGTLKQVGVVWLWPDANRAPVPVSAEDAVRWADRWSMDREVYVVR